MKPIRQDGVLSDILFESPDEIDLLKYAVHSFAPTNKELCIFVDVERSRLALKEHRVHPTTAGPEHAVFGIAVPAVFAGDVVTSIVSVTRERASADTSNMARKMIREYWEHCDLTNG